MLHVYNNLTRQKEVFKPIEPKKVGLYVCGVTVYDFCHIGHGRTYVAFDVILRYLKFSGYQVNYVRNITDIDDKIIKRSQESGQSCHDITESFSKEMYQDFDHLGITRPNSEPKATESIGDIIALIQLLVDKGVAYQSENGDVYFSVSAYKDYGQLSRQNMADLRAGSRVDVVDAKRDTLDFVLWKQAKPGEPSWESPWGDGRPGWHIECSAMTKCCLGTHFDIHGGGSDLMFPHHENERAQSVVANDDSFVNYWMHTGMVQITRDDDDAASPEKMSKSLGNFVTIREALESHRHETLRYFLLSSHYRSQLHYSSEQLKAADSSLERLYLALLDIKLTSDAELLEDFIQRFKKAMDDDFNTPEAIVVLFELAKIVNKAKKDLSQVENQKIAQDAGLTLKYLGNILGILQLDPQAFLQSAAEDEQLDEASIEGLIEERNQARAQKQFQRADEIRDELLEKGITLEDSASGTRWRRE